MKNKIILAVIILLAAYLRFSGIWYVEFKGDEAKNSFLAVDFVYNRIFPLVGDQSSVKIHNPAMFVYLLGAPFLLSKNPVVASGYIALLNIFAIYLCFCFCRKFFNKKTAFIAAAFYAVNPLAIVYSRKIWANNLLSLFVMAFFYSLYEVAIKGRHKYIIITFVSLAIFTQLHMVTLFPYSFLLLAILLIYKVRIKFLYYAIGISCFILLYSPYILYEITHNFYNLNIILGLSKAPFIITPGAFIMPFNLFTVGVFQAYSFCFNWQISQALLLLGGIIYLVCDWPDRRYFILLSWLFSLTFFLFINKSQPQWQYFVSLYPVLFITIGIFIDRINSYLIRKNYSLLKYLAWGIGSAIFLSFFICSFGFNEFIKKNSKINWPTDYGPPFRFRVEEIKHAIKEGIPDTVRIHDQVSGHSRYYKYDFIATEYIVENLDSISK